MCWLFYTITGYSIQSPHFWGNVRNNNLSANLSTLTGSCGKFFITYYIVQGTLGNAVNLEFNCSFRIETRKGVHEGGRGCYVTISLYARKRNIRIKDFVRLVHSSVFSIFGGLSDFISCDWALIRG